MSEDDVIQLSRAEAKRELEVTQLKVRQKKADLYELICEMVFEESTFKRVKIAEKLKQELDNL